MNFMQIANEYLANNASENSHTARARMVDCRKFMLHFGERDITTITQSDIVSWRNESLSREAASTVARRLATLRNVFDYAGESINIRNIARRVRYPEPAATEPDWFSEDETEKLRQNATIGNNLFERLRSQLILELGLSQGLRCGEIRKLKINQLNLSQGLILNAWGKRNRYFTAPIHPRVSLILEAYLRAREIKLLSYDITFTTLTPKEKLALPLIVSTYRADINKAESFELNEKSIWRTIKRIGILANVPNSTTHRLRHRFIKKSCIENGIAKACEMARHTNPKTTMRYTQNTIDELRSGMERI